MPREKAEEIVYEKHISEEELICSEELITDKSAIKSDDKLAGPYCMIIDIETSGLEPSCTIVQIAYEICDLQFNLVDKVNIYLNNGDGKVDYFKKISLAKLRAQGINPINALGRLAADLRRCAYVIGHNANAFDIPRLCTYFNKYGVSYVLPQLRDTMILSKEVVGARNVNGAFKRPKLEEAYTFLCNKVPDQAQCHCAEYDVFMTTECCRALLARNVTIF